MRLPERPPVIPGDYAFGKVLDELIQVRHYTEFIETEGTKYYYFEKWKFKAKEWGINPAKLWGAVKSHRRISNNPLIFSEIPGFTFTIGTPSIIQKYVHEFDLNLGGSLQGDTIIPTEEKDRYLISSLMEEAIASSQIEGAATTRKVAKEMLENNRKPKNISEQMILNNYEAMKWIVANKQAPITIQNIKKIHSILTKSTLGSQDEEGTFRITDDINVVDVQTGNPVYTPPAHKQLESLMEAFCTFANDREKRIFFLHPITKGIIMHFLIGYIHPFVDGNGRTARTMFYWYLLKKGYWLIEYMSVSRIILNSKAQYARAYLYTEQDENDLTYFVIYNLDAIDKALQDLKKYIQRKSAEKQNAVTLLRNTTFNDRQILLIQDIIQDSTAYFTVQQVQNKFGVSNQTARNDLNALVNAGLFEERKSGAKIQFLPVKGFIKKITR